MILVKNEILRQMEMGRLKISPFSLSALGPNSYNLSLGEKLLTYGYSRMNAKGDFLWKSNTGKDFLDTKKANAVNEIIIPDSGLILMPGTLYLGHTVEETDTPYHVPMVEGRSSYGRLGMFVHITAGVGDVGFKGKWTLEIAVIHPLRVYKNLEICQIIFHEVAGEIGDNLYSGKYQGSKTVEPSKSYKDQDQDGKE